MLKATATWKNGTTRTEWFFRESERVIWIAELKECCEAKKFTAPEITLGDDSDDPCKKVWGRIGMTADLTEREFDILQSGGHMADALLHNLIENRRFRLDGETYFPEASENDMHEIGNEICLEL